MFKKKLVLLLFIVSFVIVIVGCMNEKDKGEIILTPEIITYDKVSDENAVFSFNKSVKTVTQVRFDENLLTENDYEYAENQLSITIVFMKEIAVGRHTITVATINKDYTVYLIILDTRAAPPTSNTKLLVVDMTKAQDAVFEIEWNRSTFVSLTMEGAIFNENEFSYDHSSLTIKNEFYSQLQPGKYQIILATTGGTLNLELEIVIDGISWKDKNVKTYTNENLVFEYIASDKQLFVKLGNMTIDKSAYVCGNGKLIIFKEYLATLPNGITQLTLTNGESEKTFKILKGENLLHMDFEQPDEESSWQHGFDVSFNHDSIENRSARLKGYGSFLVIGSPFKSYIYDDGALYNFSFNFLSLNDIAVKNSNNSWNEFGVTGDNLFMAFSFNISGAARPLAVLRSQENGLYMENIAATRAEILLNNGVYTINITARAPKNVAYFEAVGWMNNNDIMIDNISVQKAPDKLIMNSASIVNYANSDVTFDFSKGGVFGITGCNKGSYTLTSNKLVINKEFVEKNLDEKIILTLHTWYGDQQLTILKPNKSVVNNAGYRIVYDYNSKVDLSVDITTDDTIKNVVINNTILDKNYYLFSQGKLTIHNTYLDTLNEDIVVYVEFHQGALIEFVIESNLVFKQNLEDFNTPGFAHGLNATKTQSGLNIVGSKGTLAVIGGGYNGVSFEPNREYTLNFDFILNKKLSGESSVVSDLFIPLTFGEFLDVLYLRSNNKGELYLSKEQLAKEASLIKNGEVYTLMVTFKTAAGCDKLDISVWMDSDFDLLSLIVKG